MSVRGAVVNPRAWLRAHPAAADALLAAALVLFGTVSFLPGAEMPDQEYYRDPTWWSIGLELTAIAMVTLRRRAPLAAMLAHSALGMPAALLDRQVTIPSIIAYFILIYSLTAHRGLAKSLIGGVLTLLGLIFGLAITPAPVDPGDVVGALGTTCGTWWLGRSLRLRRAYMAELEDRAERLERARDSDARAARAEERSRIARELHDVVAHHVSVMTVQAGAARRVLDRDPEGAKEALATTEQMGRTALAEMRRIVGVLRTERDAAAKGELSPQPGISDVNALTEQLRETGLSVRLWIEGQPRPLSPGIDLTAYRLVQEALTNILKHAGPKARAAVRIHYGERHLSVDIEDDGRGVAASLAANGANPAAGLGLVGMQERVDLYGGELRAGPKVDGGFEVRARFPLDEPA